MPSIGFIAPCQPSKAERPPSGPEWVHEIKHDGYRLMVHWDGDRVRCFTKNGHDWADRFPSIVEAARGFTNTTFLIDGEAVITCDDGTRRTSPRDGTIDRAASPPVRWCGWAGVARRWRRAVRAFLRALARPVCPSSTATLGRPMLPAVALMPSSGCRDVTRERWRW